MTETLPHPITFDEIDIGDRLKLEHTTPAGTVATALITADCFDEHRPIVCVLEEQESLVEYNLDDYDTITLLDRPQKGGPAWDSPVGSCWRDPLTGATWTRTSNRDMHRHEHASLFVGIHPHANIGDVLRRSGHADMIDRLRQYFPNVNPLGWLFSTTQDDFAAATPASQSAGT